MSPAAVYGLHARRLAAELRFLKATSGLGLVQLAAHTHCSKSSLERYFNGKLLPPRQAVEAISKACNGDTAHLVALWELAVANPPAWQRPAQLPHDVAGFTGRSSELDRLTALVPNAGNAIAIAVIDGIAGVGKSALAVHFAHRVADRFPDGQLHVDLRGFDAEQMPMPPAEALARFLRALAPDLRHLPTEVGELAALFRSLIGDRRMLILLDNAATTDQVRALLPGNAGCLVLVTSRHRLGGLVARDGAHHIALSTLTAAESADLLAAAAGVERIAAEPQAIAGMTRLCGYLPLALRIVAEHLIVHPSLTMTDLIGDLASEHRRLDTLATGDDSTAVRTVFSGSYRALPASAARAFRLLGLHDSPDINASAAVALTGDTPVRTREVLEALATAHLIEHQGPDRYRLHDLLHAYAAERAAAEETAQSLADARRRLLCACREFDPCSSGGV
ncbi:helix-turn-helix domain-containing protein [Nonomuraea sp. NPDC049480]|uniref:helix-turn-helix domain-containing protein n=1 Tax=Nonomuraea sp. NPDC049480 TaxID=3364353 RepID=UPI0037A94DC5